MNFRRAALTGAVAVVALAVGFGLAYWMKQPGKATPDASLALLTSPLPDLQSRPQTLAQYRGKVLVVNFWATWCTPCREEIPLFIRTQRELAGKGVQFVGIALDTPSQVHAFVQEYGVNYPILVGSLAESELLRQLGNPGGGLPYTLVFDRAGNLRENVLGGLDERRLAQLLQPYQ